MRQPSVGDVVHYQSYGTPGGEYRPEPRAAIVTEVEYVHDSEKLAGMYPSGEAMDRAVQWWDNGRGGADPRRIDGGEIPMTYRVGLCVLNPTGQFFNTSVPFAEEPSPGHWNWPPNVDDDSEIEGLARLKGGAYVRQYHEGKWPVPDGPPPVDPITGKVARQ